MYYDKRIRYLSYYESDIKLQNAGYAKFQVRDSLCQMVVYVKGPRLIGNGEAAVYLLSRKSKEADNDGFYSGGRDSGLRKHLLGNMSIRGGQGHCAVRMNAENMADSGLRYDEICGIRIELHEYQYLESQWSVVNIMPERREVPADENTGYRLRQSQEEPLKVDLIVTPVSENARVEKLIREEADTETADSMQEMMERRIRKEEEVSSVERENVFAEEEILAVEEGLPAGQSGPSAGQTMSAEEALSEEEESMPVEEAVLSVERMMSGEETLPPEEKMMTAEETVPPEEKMMSAKETLPVEERMMTAEEAVPAEERWMPAEEEAPAEEVSAEEAFLSAEQELQPDKWEQLRNTYPIVHPIREEEEYLKISPRDFVIFSEKYQQLVHNSFLLHGYHNYKHLILGKKEKDGRVVYYLGVPGTFHDREKAVAVMFGFEAFDGKREPAENGDFGYYLRRVEL